MRVECLATLMFYAARGAFWIASQTTIYRRHVSGCKLAFLARNH